MKLCEGWRGESGAEEFASDFTSFIAFSFALAPVFRFHQTRPPFDATCVVASNGRSENGPGKVTRCSRGEKPMLAAKIVEVRDTRGARGARTTDHERSLCACVHPPPITVSCEGFFFCGSLPLFFGFPSGLERKWVRRRGTARCRPKHGEWLGCESVQMDCLLG